MARKIKFPLEMADGAQVRTIDELKEHFDIEKVVGYFTDGRLLNWLISEHFQPLRVIFSQFQSRFAPA